MPVSPYGTSKLMTEWMLRDSAKAYGLQIHGAALFQCCGSRCGRQDGPVHAARRRISSRSPARHCLGQRQQMEVFGTRLRHAGRHLHPGLHSCERSDRSAFRCLAVSAPGRRERRFQLRLWARLFRAGGHRGGRKRAAAGNSTFDAATPGGGLRRSSLPRRSAHGPLWDGSRSKTILTRLWPRRCGGRRNYCATTPRLMQFGFERLSPAFAALVSGPMRRELHRPIALRRRSPWHRRARRRGL